ncbi:MAG: hypothetical protein QOI57_3272, partial [Rubrobacteraceae bacterium]|nr:hypothetical protein [Rubrobacteraceae bacterium]
MGKAEHHKRVVVGGAGFGGGPFDAFDIPTLPVAVTMSPAEIYRAPGSSHNGEC